MEDEDRFVDADTHTSFKEEQLSFRFIVLEHLRKILKLSSVEWKGGYSERNYKGEEKYIPDTRAEYWNAVNALADILSPHFDKKEKDEEEKLADEEKKLFDKWFTKHEETGLPIVKIDGADEKYKDERVILKRKLFRFLCKFLAKKTYFSVIGVIDEY